MAVDKYFLQATDALLLPEKSFYSLRIPIAHWQLRHFISSPEPDIIYYASGADVYCLNTKTKRRTHICILPFDARCTASGHGWLCVGGEEDGHFSAINIEDLANNASRYQLPIDLGGFTFEGRGYDPLPTTVYMDRIGEEIVNSISIHRLQSEERGQEDEVVAVLTNNDKTVRLFSLTYGLEDCVLDLPFPMNHATISPNGRMLVAVGDYHQAYFYERAKQRTGMSKNKAAGGRSHSNSLEWNIVSIVQLHVPSPSLNTGYFTTAWSPSGHLCAVGSECGYITVFDSCVISTAEWGEDAIVRIVPSSRPDTLAGPGAVRTMCFSPEPWDLLIWSEDQGRVCVADIRAGLRVRQVLNLDTKDRDLKNVDILDSTLDINPELLNVLPEADAISRYRRSLDVERNTAAVNFTADYIEASAERRRLARQSGVVESDNDPHGLTLHERQILDALRTTRQREEARERGTTPRSITYGISTTDGNEVRRTPQPPMPDLASLRSDRPGLPSIASLREFLRERNFDPDRPPWQPRRQASVVLSSGSSGVSSTGNPSTAVPSGNNHTTGPVPGPAPTSSGPARLNRLPPYAQRSLDSANPALPNTNEPWRIIEAAMSRASNNNDQLNQSLNPQTPQSTNSTSNNPQSRTHPQAQPSTHTLSRAPPLPSDPSTEMHRLRQLARARERVRSMRDAQALGAGGGAAGTGGTGAGGAAYEVGLLRRHGFGLRGGPQWGVRTAGLAMSEDGRTLYVGCEEGIFEVGINVQERKFWPAVEAR